MAQTKTAPYDTAEFLNSPRAVQFYMEEAMESGDPQLITHALGVVARAMSMSDIARKSGLSRESLYRSLSPTGKPEFGTIMSVLKALDLGLSVKPRVAGNAPIAFEKEKSRRLAYGSPSQRHTTMVECRRNPTTPGIMTQPPPSLSLIGAGSRRSRHLDR
jgi:probable addiction module antidote protein